MRRMSVVAVLGLFVWFPAQGQEDCSSFSLNGSWVGTFVDALTERKVKLVFSEDNSGEVRGTYLTSLGGAGKLHGTLNNQLLQFELVETTKHCPAAFRGKLLFQGDAATGKYEGSSCLGPHGTGTVTLARAEGRRLLSSEVGECSKFFYLAGHHDNKRVFHFTKQMQKWWEKKGKRKYPDLCFTTHFEIADYSLVWAWNERGWYDSETKMPVRLDIVNITLRVYQPGYDTPIFTSFKVARWRWSKPDKDTFKKAIEFIAKHAVSR